MNLWIIFLTGLTTGGLSCLAMQGGLLASVLSGADSEHDSKHDSGRDSANKVAQKKTLSQNNWSGVLMFLATKLVAHIILGFLLGLLGSAISLSLGARLLFQTFAALFMFATAMNLLNVHPIFRAVAFQPPKFLQKLIRKTTKNTSWFAPGLLGVMTIFIPCGVTQAMEVLAINSGSPIEGALIMGVFVLGTSPLFAILGAATSKLSSLNSMRFAKIAATVLILLSIYGVNGVATVLDSPITLQKIFRPVQYFFSDERFAGARAGAAQVNGVQQVSIEVLNSGYNPKYVQVKAGVPVVLTLTSNKVYSCALSFVFAEFGIDTFLDSTDTKQFTFTPTKKGRYTYSCSMGMYSGVMEVI